MLKKAIAQEGSKSVVGQSGATQGKDNIRLPLRELEEGTTSKPVGSNLKYEELDGSFACDKNDPGPCKANIDYEDSFDSVYFDEPRPKRLNDVQDIGSKEEEKKERAGGLAGPSNVSVSTKSEQGLNSITMTANLNAPSSNDSLGPTDKPNIVENVPDDSPTNGLAVPDEFKSSTVPGSNKAGSKRPYNSTSIIVPPHTSGTQRKLPSFIMGKNAAPNKPPPALAQQNPPRPAKVAPPPNAAPVNPSFHAPKPVVSQPPPANPPVRPPTVRPVPSQYPAPQGVSLPAHAGKIRKGHPEYEALVERAKKATDYSIGELMFKNGANAKQFIREALECLSKLEY